MFRYILNGAVLVWLLCQHATNGELHTVETSFGKIVGNISSVEIGSSTVEVSMFLGIPYAENPSGERRFRKPVKKGKFKETFYALSHGASCPQFNLMYQIEKMSEDCLFLNVYSPRSIAGAQKVAVMVWLHGGGFLLGDGDSFGGEKLAAFGEVVVVTINYRLGPLGFLNTNDDSVDANNGLWDQHMALKWVQENIEGFGGDRTKVTLFGASSGAASAIYHALSSASDGLFQRVIAQSGSANTFWALVPDPLPNAKRFARNMNCSVDSTYEMIKCLRSITNATRLAMNSFIGTENGLDWSPSYDFNFVTRHKLDTITEPDRKFTNRHFKKIDLLMGTNGCDGNMFLDFGMAKELLWPITNLTTINEIKQITRKILQSKLQETYGKDLAGELIDAVMFQYTNFDSPLDKDEHIRQSLNYMTDRGYFIPAFTTLENHVYQNNVSKSYQYSFNEKYPYIPSHPWIDCAVHTADVPYVFGFPPDLAKVMKYSTSQAKEQWSFSSRIMRYWTNFAKTGNPNLPNRPDVKWKEYSRENRDYLYITSKQIVARKFLNARRVELWRNYVPTVIKQHVNNIHTCT